MRNFRLDDESGHQEALFEWAAYHMDCMPELEYMHHIPNGGKRDKRTAVALKRQGVKAGVPDICLPVASIFERPRVLCSDLLRVA